MATRSSSERCRVPWAAAVSLLPAGCWAPVSDDNTWAFARPPKGSPDLPPPSVLMASTEVATIHQLSPPAPSRPRRPLTFHGCLSPLRPGQSRARGRQHPGTRAAVERLHALHGHSVSLSAWRTPASHLRATRTNAKAPRTPAEGSGVQQRPGTRARAGPGQGTSGHRRVCLGPSLPLETWPRCLPGGDMASGVLVSSGHRRSPCQGRAPCTGVALPRWGLGTRSSQLCGRETRTVTRSGLRCHGWTIPVRKRECRAKATPGGKGACGFCPAACQPAGHGAHTRVVVEPEEVTLQVSWVTGRPLAAVRSARRPDDLP